MGGVSAVVALCLAGLPVLAQNGETPSSLPDGPYEGVAPGSGNTPPRHAAVRRNEQRREPKAILSWVGFEPRGSAGSRFFIQLSRPVPYTTASSAGRFEIVLPNTRVHLRNTRRPLDTRFFDTPARSARVERRGRSGLAVVLAMRAEVTPTLSAADGANGYHLIYVDFGPGNYAPAPVAPAPPAAPREERPSFETEEPGYDPEEPPRTNIRVYQGER
jgi:hypothetical protein